MIHPGPRSARRTAGATVTGDAYKASSHRWVAAVSCAAFVLVFVLGSAAAAALTDPEELRTKLSECDQFLAAEDVSQGTDCLQEAFERSEGFKNLPIAEREARLNDVVAALDRESSRACRGGWHHSERHSKDALEAFGALVGLYILQCGEDRQPICTDDWIERRDKTVIDYVVALSRQAAIAKSRAFEVDQFLADDAPIAFLTTPVLRTWERSLCSCKDKLEGCGQLEDPCSFQIPTLCQDDNCIDPWCLYGYKLTEIDRLSSTQKLSLRRIERTGRCEGLGEEIE